MRFVRSLFESLSRLIDESLMMERSLMATVPFSTMHLRLTNTRAGIEQPGVILMNVCDPGMDCSEVGLD